MADEQIGIFFSFLKEKIKKVEISGRQKIAHKITSNDAFAVSRWQAKGLCQKP
jgi:hypothetical protein